MNKTLEIHLNSSDLDVIDREVSPPDVAVSVNVKHSPSLYDVNYVSN